MIRRDALFGTDSLIGTNARIATNALIDTAPTRRQALRLAGGIGVVVIDRWLE